jgi:acyl-CoA dehydrogenase
MIDFEVPDSIQQQSQMLAMVARDVMRPLAREYDEREHEKPWDFINMAWEFTKAQTATTLARAERQANAGEQPRGPRASMGNMELIFTIEMLSWGDAALYLCTPTSGLGGAAVEAVGTLEQKRRLLQRFAEGDPKWAAMAITESGAGSDTASIQTTARRDGDSWVLNGEKIFCTSGLMAGEKSDGFIVVWATIDKKAGRAGIKPFVVEAHTPGMKIMKLEKKLGIRASDTASILLVDCRIPLDNILGSAEVADSSKARGFEGVMQTFDASRPAVAASAIGVGRAALEFVKAELEKAGVAVTYDVPRYKLTAVQRDLLDMEAQLKAAWLLVLRAVWMADQKSSNAVEASMAKAKAGSAVTKVTQKAVELLGPLGYSRQLLVEKWMRDAKINDIFEGTGQINTLIVARRILGYSRNELK